MCADLAPGAIALHDVARQHRRCGDTRTIVAITAPGRKKNSEVVRGLLSDAAGIRRLKSVRRQAPLRRRSLSHARSSSFAAQARREADRPCTGLVSSGPDARSGVRDGWRPAPPGAISASPSTGHSRRRTYDPERRFRSKNVSICSSEAKNGRRSSKGQGDAADSGARRAVRARLPAPDVAEKIHARRRLNASAGAGRDPGGRETFIRTTSK